MNQPVTVVVIYSLSYTGTTWLNFVLGSHPDAFALGPCDRPLGLTPDKAVEACRVHGTSCPFWPRFYETWPEGANFFLHLARSSGKRVIVTNNPLPQGAAKSLEHPDVVVKPIYLIRDGRAVADSYASKFPNLAFLEVCRDWLAPSFHQFQWDPDDPDRLCLRYEDVLADQCGMLERVGRFVGLRYDERALRFWEFDHHPAAGNQGPIFMIKQFQGISVSSHARDRAFYEEQYRKLIENPGHQFEADRWRERRSTRELFLFDVICGRRNAEFGYERDRFTAEEWATFSAEWALESGQPAVESSSAGPVEPTPSAAPPVLAPIEPATVASGSTVRALEPPSPLLASAMSGRGASGVTGARTGAPGAVIAVIALAVVLGVLSLMAASGVFG
ncbi:MAG: sulfotransferase domain-containing protein [Phycisphaerales bacterium]|nr:sulfotransferase domain-containing protein [Phycisphaerales bacterium]